MSCYLLEIGCEELPAQYINGSADHIKKMFADNLSEHNIRYSSLDSGATPRRIWVNIEGLSKKGEDRLEKIQGPPTKIACDATGEINDIGKKFASSKGIPLENVKKVNTERGEYLLGVKKIEGQSTKKLLPDIAVSVINSFRFAKSMRWSDKSLRFARPIHNFLSVLDEEVLDFEIDGIKSTNTTYGHRFLGKKDIKVKNFDEYKRQLEENYVIISFDERKDLITEKIQTLFLEEFESLLEYKVFRVDFNDDLLDTVTNLVEYPHATLGTFDKKYLTLPGEVLTTTMKTHQKYFATMDKDDNVINRFVGIANMELDPHRNIKQGYEKVLLARLNDALFFYENDLKVPLKERVNELKRVTFQKELGTSYQKVIRNQALAGFIASKIAPQKEEITKEAAYLAKADLMCEMVYEFPELQGVMGREYALKQGYDQVVANAIFEHYLPKHANDDVPQGDEGAFISIADKLDTIAGCFAVGLIPTGSEDQLGLRRNAIGIIQIIKQKDYGLDLEELIEFSLENYDEIKFDPKETKSKVVKFITERFKQIMVPKHIPSDVFEAVCKDIKDISTTTKVSVALNAERDKKEFQTVCASFKRINNILKGDGKELPPLNKNLFETEQEETLHKSIKKFASHIDYSYEYGEYLQIIGVLQKFAPVIDDFFDNVMVNVEDDKVKNNRLRLLRDLRDIFAKVGDLDKLS